MTEFTIEKDVPIKPRSKYPFEEMEPGDSFHFDEWMLGAVNTAAYRYSRKLGIKLTIRKTDDGYRCWRVE